MVSFQCIILDISESLSFPICQWAHYNALTASLLCQEKALESAHLNRY